MKLSIITINLNNATGLKQTVESVIHQTFQDFEFIVIDGGSTDTSLDVIRANAQRITQWVSEPDRGIYNAMNKGLLLAQGEYVYFLNSGDRLVSPEVLEQIFIKSGCCEDLVYGHTLRPEGPHGFRECITPDHLTISLFFGFGLCHQAIFYKKSLFDKLGMYDETLKIVADWAFNIRALLARCTTRHISCAVAHYDGQGISATQKELAAREKADILKQLLPDAVYRDYLRLQYLESEYGRLKQFENWVTQIRHRNVLQNFAMITYWFFLNLKQKFLSRKQDPT